MQKDTGSLFCLTTTRSYFLWIVHRTEVAHLAVRPHERRSGSVQWL